MDKIILQGMQLYAYHGLLPEERLRGQLFSIDVELYLDLAQAGFSDKVEDSINYTATYQVVRGAVENPHHPPFHLLEALAESIAGCLLLEFSSLQAVLVRVGKPRVPLPGPVAMAAVEIYRQRKSEC